MPSGLVSLPTTKGVGGGADYSLIPAGREIIYPFSINSKAQVCFVGLVLLWFSYLNISEIGLRLTINDAS